MDYSENSWPGLQEERIAEYIRSSRLRFIEELKEFVRFPSVSGQRRYAEGLLSCAGWLAAHLEGIGMEDVRVLHAGGNPIICAEWAHRPGAPTVLIYGHYDVQPPGRLQDWVMSPFEPVVHSGNIYGRGASDDKGQLFTHVKALEYYLSRPGGPPVNIKCLFEGEEEIGSPSLGRFLTAERRNLASDTALISDMSMPGPERPAITYSLRGALGVDIEVSGPAHELHSGLFGGAVHNPMNALSEILSCIHYRDGRIAIPGFYDSVRDWGKRERAYMKMTGPADTLVLKEAGAGKGWGEPGYSLYERITLRPAISITDFSSGQLETGSAVIPPRATARLDLRIIPDQRPDEIEWLFRDFIERISPETVRVSVRTRASASPVLIDRSHPAVRAASEALRRGFNTPPVFRRSGGTIPAVSLFGEILGIPAVLMGFALPDDRPHGPNEKFNLRNFYRGIVTSVCFMEEFGKYPVRTAEASGTGAPAF